MQHQTANGRYVVPSFVERTGYGVKESNPYNKLFENRIIFLGTPIDDTAANDVMTQLVCLEFEDDRPIEMYINSPGGSLTAMTALYDTMQYIRPQVHTFCLGQAASAAALLLAAGTKGKRSIVPSARVLIRQPAVEVIRGQVSDLEIQAAEISRMRTGMERLLAQHTGQSQVRVHNDIERELILTAEQALEYGLVDAIIPSRKLSR
ncbi:ATP-dependent Clp protease proteolytic subunit [Actinomycetes bacterium KLBMP 9759]